jgi:hypothetical protein
VTAPFGGDAGCRQAPAPHPQRRLADRLLDAGTDVARRYVEADRYDPGRPSLGEIVAETLAQHERIGEERILTRVRALIEQRTALRDERLDLALRHVREGNLPPAASELRWASDLDEQISALRLLLADPPPIVDEPNSLGQDRRA